MEPICTSYEGTFSGMAPGTVLGHEAVGIIEEVGADVRNLAPGDRVVIPSTIGCGACSYCRAGYYAQCDVANPNGPQAGTCFFGGPRTTGPIDGLQAEYARVPFAHTGPVKLPESMSDDDAILLSDIFPTSWFAARLAEVSPGDTVAVFGMNKNVTVKMGNCNHRRYLPELVDIVSSGRMGLSANLTNQETLDSVIDAYRAFDRREPGWIKVAVAVAPGSGMQVSGRSSVDARVDDRSRASVR